jgi:hypothetical protein
MTTDNDSTEPRLQMSTLIENSAMAALGALLGTVIGAWTGRAIGAPYHAPLIAPAPPIWPPVSWPGCTGALLNHGR